MPDRMIRDELLESERWLGLKDNADRLAFVALLLHADALGNFSAEPFRLLRAWRDFGINTTALVAKTLSELADHDLIRLYQADGRALLHVPRFRQRLRHLNHVFPPSPWTTDEEKQLLATKKTVLRPTHDGLTTAKVKESKVKESKDIGRRRPLPPDFGISERVASWASKRDVHNLERHLEYFVGYARANGKTYADWDQALMNAIRDDWAKIGDGRKKVAL